MQVIGSDDRPSALADPAQFTGRVWRTDLLTPPDTEHLAGVRFLYEPGARSHWHVHEREQVIIAVYGSGLVAWEGLAAPTSLRAGDWWHVRPGMPHWHERPARPRSPTSPSPRAGRPPGCTRSPKPST